MSAAPQGVHGGERGGERFGERVGVGAGSPVLRAWDPQTAVAGEFWSPAYRLPYPDLVGDELMPADIRADCDRSWRHPLFARRNAPVWSYSDVFVANQGLVIRPADRGVYRSSITQHTELDLARGLRQLQEAESRDDVPVIPGASVLCIKPGGDNYGHWLIEMLPKLDFARRAGITDATFLVPAAAEPLASVIRDSAALLGVRGAALRPTCAPVAVKRLYNVTSLTDHGTYMSPQVLRPINRIKASLVADPPARLYVTRGSGKRKFAREKAVCAAFARRGYRVVDPGRMTFAEQAQAFMGATEVVGCMGAALSNLAFAPSRIPVLVFAPAAMADTFFWFIAGLRRQRYREVRCRVSSRPQGLGPRDHDLIMAPGRAVALAEAWARETG